MVAVVTHGPIRIHAKKNVLHMATKQLAIDAVPFYWLRTTKAHPVVIYYRYALCFTQSIIYLL